MEFGITQPVIVTGDCSPKCSIVYTMILFDTFCYR